VSWPAIADLVVKRSLKLAPGERVVLYWDQASDRGAAAPLRAAIVAAGGVVVDLSAPTDADLAAIARLPAESRTRQQASRDSTWARVFRDADAAIWLPTALPGLPGRPFEHLVDRSRVRSIHFHWFLPPDAADVATVEELYAKAIAVDPALLLTRIQGIETALKGATVRISAPNGTNLTLRVPATAWVHRNTGDASRAKVASARSVRDREEELPASVFRTTDLAAAEGTFVGYASFDTRSPIVQATFTGGRVTKLGSKRGAEALVTSWEKATGDKALPGELVIGTNPELPAVLPSGFMPYYGYGAGVVRVAIGDNWESGGRNRSSNGEILMFLLDATVEANGKVVVKDGKLVGR
jgi:leucyl aminopeptidase (aminopeptidase T)